MPVTVLSRCQRFDLRRIPAEKLAAHFAEVAEAEGVEVEAEALALIARAAEGSARDGLSILDQAIAHGDGSGHRRAGPRHARPGRPRPDPPPARTAAGRRRRGGAWPSSTRPMRSGSSPAALLRGLMEVAARASPGPRSGRAPTLLQSAEEREAAAELAGAAVLGRPPPPVADAAQGPGGRHASRPTRTKRRRWRCCA